MSDWNREELDAIGRAAELEIAPMRADGTLRPYITIWVVRIGDDLYVRSYHGPRGTWFGAAQRSTRARIRASGFERDVTLRHGDDVHPAAVDDAYRTKYGRSSYVDAMVTPEVAATTLQLAPR